MVKSILGVNHQGLRDWIIQRASALVMTVYSIGLIGYLLFNPDLSFTVWHDLFSLVWVKVATLLFIFSLLLHAWVGIWTIFTDYIKPVVLRLTLNLFVLLMLVACYFWALLILWSV